MARNFNTIVVYNEQEILDLVYAKESVMMLMLKRSEYWDDIEEELSQNSIEDTDLAVEDIERYGHIYSFSTRVRIFRDQSYHD